MSIDLAFDYLHLVDDKEYSVRIIYVRHTTLAMQLGLNHFSYHLSIPSLRSSGQEVGLKPRLGQTKTLKNWYLSRLLLMRPILRLAPI